MGNENREEAKIVDGVSATLIKKSSLEETAGAIGIFHAELRDRHGNLKWQDTYKNTVVTVGKNLSLDTILAGSAYTVTGPFMGLISSVSFTSIAAGDTMASHAGWTEAGPTNAPDYSGNRQTAVFSAASGGSKALSSALSYTFSAAGTVKGSFIVFGTGAVNTKDSTAGTLLSAGLFTGGDKPVANTDVLNISWSLAL